MNRLTSDGSITVQKSLIKLFPDVLLDDSPDPLGRQRPSVVVDVCRNFEDKTTLFEILSKEAESGRMLLR